MGLGKLVNDALVRLLDMPSLVGRVGALVGVHAGRGLGTRDTAKDVQHEVRAIRGSHRRGDLVASARLFGDDPALVT